MSGYFFSSLFYIVYSIVFLKWFKTIFTFFDSP